MNVRRRAAVMVRFAGEKGSCDLFPTLVQTRSIGAGMIRASWFLWVRPRYESRTYKNTTCTLQNKKQGLYRKGQKSGLGRVFGRWVRGWLLYTRTSRYLRIHVSEHLYI